MPEESFPTPNPNDDAIRRLERRIENLEYAAQSENRWWRGGLIAALVLIALSILVASHRHRHRLPPQMMGQMAPGMMAPGMMAPGMMGGWQGPRVMPYGPPPPQYWGGQGDPRFFGPQERWEWHHREHDDGPGPGPEAQPEQQK